MLGVEFYSPARQIGFVGAQLVTGGGGKCSLPSISIGGCRRTPGCLVKVWGCLEGLVKVRGGRLQVEGFLDRIGYRCLKWKVRSVVGMKAEGLVVREGGVQGSWMLEFGKEWGSAVLGIPGEVVMGCCEGFG